MGIKENRMSNCVHTSTVENHKSRQRLGAAGRGGGNEGRGFIPNATSRHHKNDSANGWAQFIYLYIYFYLFFNFF